MEYALFGTNKNSGGSFPAAVSCETLIAIEFTGHELPAALALGLADDDRIIIFTHQLLHIQKRLGKGGGDGLELAKVGKQGQHGLFVALDVHVVVEAEGFNVGLLAVLKVLHIQARLPGESVDRSCRRLELVLIPLCPWTIIVYHKGTKNTIPHIAQILLSIIDCFS